MSAGSVAVIPRCAECEAHWRPDCAEREFGAENVAEAVKREERVLNLFLKDVSTHEALDLRDALMPLLAAHDFYVNATADDGTPTILAFDGEQLTFYRRDGDAIDTVTHQVRGAVLSEHRKLVDGGLLFTGFTLKHPVLPRSGSVEIHARDLEDEATFRERVAVFLLPR